MDQLDLLLKMSAQISRVEEQTKGIPDLAARVQKLEDSKLRMVAWASGAGAVVTLLFKFVAPALLSFLVSQGVPVETVLVAVNLPIEDLITGLL